MAEARLGVAPMPALQAGYEVNTDAKECQVHLSPRGLVIYVPHPKFLLRNLRRHIWNGWKKMTVAFLPFPLWGVISVASGVTYWVMNSPSVSWQRSGRLATLLWNLDSYNPLSRYLSTPTRVSYLAVGISCGILYLYAAAQRFIARKLLTYHGWMSERGKPSLTTKVWGLLMKVFIGRGTQMQAYQAMLPSLPLPSLKDTCDRYIECAKPMVSEAELEQLKEDAKKFQLVEGKRLQFWLRIKHLFYNNYISDWWLQLVYLRARESVCITSNWYGIFFGRQYVPTTNQAARAAAVTYNFVKLSIRLENQNMAPTTLSNVVPLCMAQYAHCFSTTRVPGSGQDVLVKADRLESRHVVVIHKGCYYNVPVFDPTTGRLLSPLQLALAFDGILLEQAAAHRFPEEGQLPALTAGRRDEWHELRQKFFINDPLNRQNLHVIESALFVVCLDDYTTDTISAEGKNYMCGNGHNRWSDKSFNLVVTPDGRAGVHVEHSWGDAPALAHMIEFTIVSDEKREFYEEDGSIKKIDSDKEQEAKGALTVVPAARLHFNVPPELASNIRRIREAYVTQIADVDLHIVEHGDYGKQFIAKTAKMSPDAYVQMALQVAYFRDQGRFDHTYESSMTRLYIEGRTETIRSLSVESVAFVNGMQDPTMAKSDRIALLRKACDRHQKYTQMAMTGEGVDRHLFALYVVSRGLGVTSPFLEFFKGNAWRLSTSQVLTRQCPELHESLDKFRTPNGGFGPVVDDGYGICYCLFAENYLFFNVSSKVSAKNTDSQRFGAAIVQALADMKALFA